jgi:hypothetical protein
MNECLRLFDLKGKGSDLPRPSIQRDLPGWIILKGVFAVRIDAFTTPLTLISSKWRREKWDPKWHR